MIINTIGILSSVYKYGYIAYIGGGFGAGIHNILEAAVYGIPVVFGPKYKKFKEANDLIAKNASFTIKDYYEFEQTIGKLNNSPKTYKTHKLKQKNMFMKIRVLVKKYLILFLENNFDFLSII